MAAVNIHQHDYEIDCIIFDKDDTLIEFNALWGPRTQRWVEAMSNSLDLPDQVQKNLFSLLGYFPEKGQVRAESPLAVATVETLCTIAAGELCRYGLPWHQATAHAQTCAQPTLLAEFNSSEIRPKGNIAKVMHELVQAGVHLAIVTSDDRPMTEATLDYLRVIDLISVIVCGDDPVPNKPAPDAFWLVTDQLGISPKRVMMVGDTFNDMQFASNAGAGFRVGVASISGDANSLLAQADAVVTSIDEFKVALSSI